MAFEWITWLWVKRDKADKYENVYEKYYVTTRTRITDPESSVHLKLSISAFKNVQIRVDGVRPLNKEYKLQGLDSYAHASECRH